MRSWIVVVLVGCASQSAPPPARPAPVPTGDSTSAQLVPPTMLEGKRVKGSILIPPDDIDKFEMMKHGLSRVIYTSKLCLDEAGHVGSVTTLRSSGLPSYDEKIRKHMSGWQYQPYVINGSPAAVCTTVTVIYNQKVPKRSYEQI